MATPDFKYYEKIKTGKSTRYFYSKEEYDAYMNNRLKSKSPFKAVSKFLSKFGKKPIKKPIKETKSKVNDDKSPVKSVSNFLKKFGKKSTNEIKSKINKGKSFVDKIFKKK